VYVWLGSQIGKPVGEPLISSAQLVLRQGVTLDEVRHGVKEIIGRELAAIDSFTMPLARGELPVW
jgi:S-adenosylmethionine synthetase